MTNLHVGTVSMEIKYTKSVV